MSYMKKIASTLRGGSRVRCFCLVPSVALANGTDSVPYGKRHRCRCPQRSCKGQS